MTVPAAPAKRPAPEVIAIPPGADEVCCDGGSGAVGHPQVFYTFDGQPSVTCGYCGRVFSKNAG